MKHASGGSKYPVPSAGPDLDRRFLRGIFMIPRKFVVRLLADARVDAAVYLVLDRLAAVELTVVFRKDASRYTLRL